jgi:hypothetical protein
LLEILIYETLECLWVNFAIPDLVKKDVQKVYDVIISTITSLCHLHSKYQDILHYADIDSNNQEDLISEYVCNYNGPLINVPEYFFVSYRIAKKYPHMIESMIIQSFETYMPEEVSKLWLPHLQIQKEKIENEMDVDSHIRTIFNLSFFISMTINLIAHIPLEMHRFVFRMVQPFVIAGCTMVCVWLVNRPAILSLCLVLLVVIIVLGMYYYQKVKLYTENKSPVEINNMFDPSSSIHHPSSSSLRSDIHSLLEDDSIFGDGDEHEDTNVDKQIHHSVRNECR